MNKRDYISTVKSVKNIAQVQDIRFLTANTFVIRFDRGDLVFKPGQYLTAGVKDSLQHREYSIYSAEGHDYLEILVREVLDGDVSVQLKNIKTGEQLEINGPFGFMNIKEEHLYTKKFVLIASGTGIAPFHSFITTYKELDYTVMHGVRYQNEAYDHSDYDPQRYILCTSKDQNGYYHGRVTDFLRGYEVTPDMLFYVCGNSNMIYEVYDILRKKGVENKDIFSEVYF